MRGPTNSSGTEEEFKTPDGSYESDEQGMPSPSLKSLGSQNERFKEKKKMLLDGKLVKFGDFDILETLGEGSFGRVFLCEKRDNGQRFALKTMKK